MSYSIVRLMKPLMSFLMILQTPEKWDVVTRKSGTDENSLGNRCGLLIIDEV